MGEARFFRKRVLVVLGLLAVGGASAAGAGCSVNSAYDAQRDNPLGPSFWIVPTPSDDDGLLGRTFAKPPDTALTLEEQSSPNPCASKLAEKREAQMQNHYENAIDTKTSASAGGLLSLYGFSADAGTATHLVYKVSTTTKLTRLDTPEYQECCKEKGCGWGYVASLVRGEGEYAAATEASAQVSGNYSVITGGASRSFSVVHKKDIKGYLAAILVAHNRAEAAQACPPDRVWAKIECVPRELPGQQEQLCKRGNPQASDPMWKDNQQMLSLFKQQQESACNWVATHGGPATTVPPPAGSAPATAPTAPTPAPTTPAATKPATAAELAFEPGDYVAINSFWSGKLTFRPDGTFSRDTGQKGVWIAEGKKLTLKWSDGAEDQLDATAPGAYQNFTGFFRIKKAASSGPAPAPTTAPTTSSKPPTAPPPTTAPKPSTAPTPPPPPSTAPTAPKPPTAPTTPAPPASSPSPRPGRR